MPQHSTTDSRAQAAAERLKAIRARVEELHRRIREERDPKAVEELRAEIGKLTELISEIVRASGGQSDGVAKAAPAAWPRDLNTEPHDAGEWGADPVEVAGG